MADVASAAPLLELLGASKAFGRSTVLSGVDFDLHAGEVHVLAGENGAGKTTLIKIIAGAHADWSGEMRLSGEPVRLRSPQEARRRGVAAIHQELSLVDSMSVEDNLFLGREHRRLHGLDRRRQKRDATAVLQRLGLDLDLDRDTGEYPVSVRQMIEIARSLLTDARIFILDEPTSALPEPDVERLFRIVRALRDGGCGIIYISHKMEEIERIADRITVLRDGRRIATRPRHEMPPHELIRLMVGREIEGQFPQRQAAPGSVRLEVRDLTVTDPRLRRPVVDRVSFSVRRGEVVGLAGLAGSGTSEALWGIFGAAAGPVEGEVRIDGSMVGVRSPRRAIDAGLALLTNDRKSTGLVQMQSVRLNIVLPQCDRMARAGWRSTRREHELAARAAASLGIRLRSIEQEVWTLSGGNQQKVALAKWIEIGPRVLLLDEPTRGIDVGAKREIYEKINEWTSAGIAIVLISSELPELLALSDRIVVLHRGRLVAEFNAAEATADRVIGAAMGHPEEVAA